MRDVHFPKPAQAGTMRLRTGARPSRSLQSASRRLAWVRGIRHRMVRSCLARRVFGGTPALAKIKCIVPAKPGSARVEMVSEAQFHCKTAGDTLADRRRFLSGQFFDLLAEEHRVSNTCHFSKKPRFDASQCLK